LDDDQADLARARAREASRALRASDAMSRSILNARLLAMALLDSSDAISVQDSGGAILAWNGGAERVYGYTESEALAMVGAELVPKELQDELVDVRARALSGEVVSLETRRVGRDGTEVDVLLTARAIVDESGVALGVALTERDITERKRFRDALQDMATRLATTNHELERRNAELDEFTSVVSHDLQAPLRTISHCCERAAQLVDAGGPGSDAAPDPDAYLARATAAAGRMRGMIQDLLRCARLETSDDRHEPVSLDEVLAEVLENVEGRIRECDAEIEVAELPEVVGDRTQLVQLFQNLISNGLKFCGSEPPRVGVSCSPGPGCTWRITVRDHGIGIESRQFERIFGVFQRLHARDEYGGTGIGLSICRKIAEGHGGQISVESEVGCGTRFHVLLPAAPPAEKPERT
jgi:PAS domain S-box-containing protein